MGVTPRGIFALMEDKACCPNCNNLTRIVYNMHRDEYTCYECATVGDCMEFRNHYKDLEALGTLPVPDEAELAIHRNLREQGPIRYGPRGGANAT